MFCNLKNIIRLLSIVALAATAGACGNSKAKKIFEFSKDIENLGTKDVAIHVMVDFFATDSADVKIDLGTNHFTLNSFVKVGEEFEAVALQPLGLTDSEAVFDMPVTITGITYTFDAIAKVPVGLMADDTGYTFMFTLKTPANAALQLAGDGLEGKLRSFKTQILPGRPAAENPVPISLATTLASDLIESLKIKITKETISDIIVSLKPLLLKAHSELELSLVHKVKAYTMGLAARTMMLLASDTPFQETLVKVMTTSTGAAVASSTVMSQVNKVMSDIATTSAAVFASQVDKAPIGIFKTSTSLEIADTAKNPVYNTVYTPDSVTFVDQDKGAGISGPVTITPKSATYAPAGYSVYLGGSTREAMQLVNLGTTQITLAGNAVFNIPTGTTVPSGATSLWVFPIASDGTVINSPKVITLENNGSTPTISLTGPTSIDDNGSVTLGGSCSPDGATVVLTPPSGFTPATGSCSCASSTLSSCTVFTDTSHTADGSAVRFSAKITSAGREATGTFDVVVTGGSSPAETFGAQFGNYMEDGLNALCIKISDTTITCKGSYFNGSNDVTQTTGWTSGAKIRGYYNLESTTFVEDTAGDIWSVGSGPLGRTGSSSSLGKITFTGKTAGAKLIGIHGEHQRATALFNDGRVFSWAGTTPPAEQLTSGVHTKPIKFLYEGYGHECFIDKLDDMYCKDSSPSTAAFTWTPTANELVLSNTSGISMPWNHGSATWDIVIRRTSGAIYTTPRYTPSKTGTYTNTGVTASSAAGHFGYTPAVGTQDFLAVGSDGKVYNKSGALTTFGSANVAVGVSFQGVGGRQHFILSGDGKLYGSATSAMTSADALGGYSDIKAMRAFYGDICGIRTNGEVRCAGSRTGGSFDSPVLFGTLE